MDHRELAARLIDRRAELAVELDHLTQPPPEGSSVSFGKRIGDGTAEAVERLATTATARSISRSINDIDAALREIEAGTYGICEVCGMSIPAERLEARPATTRCVSCAS